MVLKFRIQPLVVHPP